MTVGERIRYWRKRRGGMTQAVLAGLAGISQPYLSQIEGGTRVIDKRSTLVSIARVLQVTVADLVGEPGDPADPMAADVDAVVPAVWTALVEVEEGVRRRPDRTPEQLAATVTHLSDLRVRGDYPAMARLLPGLLPEAAAHGGVALAQVAGEASSVLRNLGHRHLALLAARLAVAGAHDAGDPAWIGAARFWHTIALPVEMAEISRRVADRALVDLQGVAGRPDARRMLGQLHLSAALMCAADGREDDARAHLTEADREAATLDDPGDGLGFSGLGFGPTNVGLWRMTVAVEMGEDGKVIELSRTVRPDVLRDAGRHLSYWTSLGRALAHSGRADRAAEVAFIRAEHAAPHMFAHSPLVNQAVLALVRRARRRRAISDDLRTVALRLGIEA